MAMAVVRATNNTAIQAGTLTPSTLLTRGQHNSSVEAVSDVYEASALATSSIIYMGPKLSKGTRIVGYQLAYDALKTVSLGVSCLDAITIASERFLASVDTANAAGVKSAILVDGLDYVVGTNTDDDQLVVTVTGVSAATGTIKLTVFYTRM